MTPLASEVTIGIITALPIECAAVRIVVDDLADQLIPGDPNRYIQALVPSSHRERPHRTVLTMLTRDGNKTASAASADLIRSFPHVHCVIMVGVAGGIPSPGDPARHVRLGDIVVGTKGVVDYDHVHTRNGIDQLRRHVDGMSPALLQAANELRVREIGELRPWEEWLREHSRTAASVFDRPDDSADILFSAGAIVAHPPRHLSLHRDDSPKIHYGAIASADRLLRDERRRDELARQYGVSAVEMEASGVAAGAFLHSVPWFVIRGIADYCENSGKNDVWHPYAALGAAAYLRALLGVCPPFTGRSPGSPDLGVESGIDERQALVRLLLEVPAVGDERIRQQIVDRLPPSIRNSIRRFTAPVADVHEILATCLDFDAGVSELINAIRAVAGDSRSVRRAAQALLPYAS